MDHDAEELIVDPRHRLRPRQAVERKVEALLARTEMVSVRDILSEDLATVERMHARNVEAFNKNALSAQDLDASCRVVLAARLELAREERQTKE